MNKIFAFYDLDTVGLAVVFFLNIMGLVLCIGKQK